MIYDYAIIGGGVVGSACLNKLARVGKKCILLEKENDVGFGSSKANSGLVHTGFDCKPNTLKAKLNVRGASLMPSLAKRLNVPFIKNGHLVVGNNLSQIEELYNRGQANGVADLEIVSGEKLYSLEPNLSKDIKYALYAKNGGIISSYELSVALCEEAIICGAKVIRNFAINNIDFINNTFNISSLDTTIQANKIINCAGAGFNEVAKLTQTEQYDINFRRGEYYILDSSCNGYINHTVFPLPTSKSKGILVTPTTFGNILVGPTSYESDDRPITTRLGLAEVKQNALVNFPTLPIRSNIRVFSGVRNVVGDDFIIEKSKINDNVINVAGICSPGLSACPAIAEYILKLENIANKELVNLPTRKTIPRIASLPLEKQNELIEKNPEFGKVICKCENVSLGEIKATFNSPLPPLSVDAVKRRTRAGMGRCQSGFCIFSVMDVISKELKLPFDMVEKDARGSSIIKCEIKPNGGAGK